MRLALLTTNMAPGGAETQVAHLAIRLRRRGWDVHVISLLPPTAFVDELRSADVPLHASKIPLLLRTLHPQILHCHMFHANILGRLMRSIFPFPAVISTLHSMAESKRSTGAVRHRDWMYRATDRLADVTVAVSQAAAQRHLDAKAARRITVIPNGIDTDVFHPDPEARARLRRELGIEDQFTWLAVGRLMWKKNYPALLEAFSRLRSGTLLIAGSGPDEETLKRQAGPNVRFLGQRTDISALMNAADAFVLSSVIEGLPLVLLEAAATGLPSVAVDVGGVRETGVGLIAQPGQLATCMQQLVAMPADHRYSLGRAARKRVLNEYALDTVVTRWETLYERICEPSTR